MTAREVPRATIRHAAKRIRDGGIVAFPTETIYGLGANALDARAVAKIFIAKGRPADNPLIVHVTDMAMLRKVVARVSPDAKRLMGRFWPGPLTILFPRSTAVPEKVTAGLPTVAVRMPAHPIARALIEEAGVPIAAPSANKSGRPSPTSARHVREDFPTIIRKGELLLLDGGECDHGLESTIVMLGKRPRVLRVGAVTVEALRSVLPAITVAQHMGKALSPGMKYKHYAPKKPVILFSDPATLLAYAKRMGRKDPVILCKETHRKTFVGYACVSLGKTDAEMARRLFAALRTRQGKTILVVGVAKRGIGRSVMDRLERAATKII
jgi:L-threonylcarbamoyladenylate synthase